MDRNDAFDTHDNGFEDDGFSGIVSNFNQTGRSSTDALHLKLQRRLRLSALFMIAGLFCIGYGFVAFPLLVLVGLLIFLAAALDLWSLRPWNDPRSLNSKPLRHTRNPSNTNEKRETFFGRIFSIFNKP